MRIDPTFYKKSALEMAPELIGKLLCRNINGEIIKSRILETECYFGESDTACHAHKGKTKRTSILYEQGGVAYVYLCYGIHYLLNIVSGEKDHPEAVLIRAIDGFDGPGKLTKFLKIDISLNGENLITSDKLWIEDDKTKLRYSKTKRIGIEYASKEYREKQWRYVAKNNLDKK